MDLVRIPIISDIIQIVHITVVNALSYVYEDVLYRN